MYLKRAFARSLGCARTFLIDVVCSSVISLETIYFMFYCCRRRVFGALICGPTRVRTKRRTTATTKTPTNHIYRMTYGVRVRQSRFRSSVWQCSDFDSQFRRKHIVCIKNIFACGSSHRVTVWVHPVLKAEPNSRVATHTVWYNLLQVAIGGPSFGRACIHCDTRESNNMILQQQQQQQAIMRTNACHICVFISLVRRCRRHTKLKFFFFFFLLLFKHQFAGQIRI